MSGTDIGMIKTTWERIPYVPFGPPIQLDDGWWQLDWDTLFSIVLQVRSHGTVTRWPEGTSLEAKKALDPGYGRTSGIGVHKFGHARADVVEIWRLEDGHYQVEYECEWPVAVRHELI
jgi:hypothetical protein